MHFYQNVSKVFRTVSLPVLEDFSGLTRLMNLAHFFSRIHYWLNMGESNFLNDTTLEYTNETNNCLGGEELYFAF